MYTMLCGKVDEINSCIKYKMSTFGDFLWRIALLDIAGRLVVLNAVISYRLCVVGVGRRLVSLGLSSIVHFPLLIIVLVCDVMSA